jgi:hypothetical protein
MSLLKVCQMYPCKEKLELQRVCQIARAELRRGVSEQTVIEALLAERRAGAAEAALAVQEGDANTCGIHVVTVDEANIAAQSEPPTLIDVCSLPPVSTMEAPRSPPMAAPDTPPQTADYAHLVSRGRTFMGDWTPSPKSQATIASAGFRVQGDSDMAATVPVTAEAMSPRALTTGQWPPLDILFKGGPGVCAKVERTFRSLCAGGDYEPLDWLSVVVGPRGSYRQSTSWRICYDT